MKLFHHSVHKGPSQILISLFSLILLTALAVPAEAAPVTWNLTNVNFSDGGGATGWFTLDTSLPHPSSVIDWYILAMIHVPAGFPLRETAALTPGLPLSTAFADTSGVTIIDRHVGQSEYTLQLLTEQPLIPPGPIPLLTGASPGASAYTQIVRGIGAVTYRNVVTSGQLEAASVPEPSTFLLVGTVLVGMWGLRRKKFK